MQLAKNVIDIRLSTNNLEPMLRFWQQDVAVRFDHVLPVRRGQKQYRHDEQGSVIKLNHHPERLPEAAPSGYRELMIARDGLQKPLRMVDPDGNRVQLVPPGFDGVIQLGVAMGVRSLREHRRFYGDILGFAEQSWSRDGDRWVIESARTLPDGTETHAVNHLIPRGKDAFTWESAEYAADGSLLSRRPPLKVTRVKAGP